MFKFDNLFVRDKSVHTSVRLTAIAASSQNTKQELHQEPDSSEGSKKLCPRAAVRAERHVFAGQSSTIDSTNHSTDMLVAVEKP